MPLPRDRAAFTELPVLGGVGCLRATYRAHAFTPHAHDTFVVGVVEAGAVVVRCEQVQRTVGVGDVLVIHPGAVHSAWSAAPGEWRYRALYPTAGVVAAAVEGLGATSGGRAFDAHVISEPRLAAMLSAVLAALRPDRSPMALEESLVGALRLLWTHAGARSENDACEDRAAIRRAREYIDAHATRALSLTEVAAAAGWSRYHLIRAFTARYGLSPYAYYTQRRVVEAQRLIAAGHAPARAALACGFADQSHMTRHFKRVLGVTPGAYAGGMARGARATA